MGETSIGWTDFTFNPWWGCTRVSPGCVNCYAESFARRTGHDVWGPSAERRFFGDGYWAKPYAWCAAAIRAGERRRVFCASMADVFEAGRDRVGAEMDAARKKLWRVIHETKGGLDWLLLTKRPELVSRFAPWGRHELVPWPSNVWIGTTVEDQQRAKERLPWLVRMPARVRFVSYEPALEAVDFRPWLERWRCKTCGTSRSRDQLSVRNGKLECPGCLVRGFVDQIERDHAIDWIIVGGESGGGSRPFDPAWARSVLEDCRELARPVPVFVKQLGAKPHEGLVRLRLKHTKGEDPEEWPADLRVRNFPKEHAA